ncbi:MAG TPA: hypothetical protein VF786_06505 [Terriglobales bacterium]
MRIAARTIVILVAITLTATASLCQQTSAVITPQASIYNQTSTKSRVLRTLELGQRVSVDMTISNAEGTWCLVREIEGKEKPGYIPCSQLTSEALPKVVPTVPVFDASSSPATTATGSHLTTGGDNAPLSTEQVTMQQLLESSGLEGLRLDLAATLRRYGVTDNFSFLERMKIAVKNPFTDSFCVVTEPKIRRGAVRYKAFWKAYWNALSDEQKKLAMKRDPYIVLDYMQSQSEPDSAFLGWVLGSMRQSKRK